MTMVRYVTVLLLIALPGHGQVPQKNHRAELSSQANAPVRSLYQQLVSQPVGGIPAPEQMKVLSTYLSRSLIRRIEQTRACENDWFRRHPKNDVKAPLDWLEFGLFSGPDDREGPRAFQIERTDSKEDGSFRVYVKLTAGLPPERPWNWRVAVVVVRENGQFNIDDVVFLRDENDDTESRLSEILTHGCDGSRWVGFNQKRRQ
jgi:hypothetical protein